MFLDKLLVRSIIPNTITPKVSSFVVHQNILAVIYFSTSRPMNIFLRQFWFSFTIFFSIILSALGCNYLAPRQNKCSPVSQSNSNDLLLSPTTDITTDIYLDATLSMQGFTNDETFSYYQQTIPLLESAVIKTWKNGTVNFNRFGDKIENLPDRKFLEANKAAFYSDKNYNRKTFIENVINTADTNHLSIIVTDLFQDNADINPLIEKIKTKFIGNELAIGVMAIKSQFNGTIYDVGSNNYSFVYKTSENSILRPFYIVALGSHADIAVYFDTLENSGLKDFPVKEQIIFSRFLTDKPSNFSNAETVDIKNMNDVSEVLVKSENGAAEYKELKVVNKGKPSIFVANLSFKQLPKTIGIGTQLEPEIKSWVCRKPDNSDSSAPATFVENPTVKDALDVSAAITKPEIIEFKLKVKPEKFDSDEVNCFQIILRPKEYVLPAWIDEWNMTDGQIDLWHKSPATFEGTKTYNLKRFLQDLWGTTQKSHNPKVADFYCYIKPD